MRVLITFILFLLQLVLAVFVMVSLFMGLMGWRTFELESVFYAIAAIVIHQQFIWLREYNA